MNEPSKSGQPVTPERIMQMVWGFAPPLMIHAALQNGLIDELSRGPKTIGELTAKCGVSQRGATAVIEGLLGLGLIVRDGDRFSLSPDTAAFLVAGKPGYLGGLLRHLLGLMEQNWVKLPEVVKTGKPPASVNEQTEGTEFFSDFVEDLFHMNYPAAKALAETLAASGSPAKSGAIRVLDLAAGSGVWGIGAAHVFPNAQITALDWPGVTQVTRKVAAKNNVGDRLRTIDGDIQKTEFGGPYDLVTLGHILHSEGEAASRKLLKKVFAALKPGGKVAIAEFVVNDDRNGPPLGLIFAVNMLLHTESGSTFSFGQMTAWLTEIGFVSPQQIPVPGPSPILVATKPG